MEADSTRIDPTLAKKDERNVVVARDWITYAKNCHMIAPKGLANRTHHATNPTTAKQPTIEACLNHL